MSKNAAPVNATGLPKSRRVILRTLAALPVATVPALASERPEVGNSHHDASLIVLGRQVRALRLSFDPQMTGEVLDVLQGHLWDLCDEIEALPATTFDGMKAKAEAFAAYYLADELGCDIFPDIPAGQRPSSDVRMLKSILAGLLDSSFQGGVA